MHRNHEVIALEMSHFSLTKIDGIQYFTGLKELCIVTQEITTIEGLSQCPLLETLWIADCKIEQIKGLEKNTRLSRLYLYSNHISKIENISHLQKLEVLWLGDNSIIQSSVEIIVVAHIQHNMHTTMQIPTYHAHCAYTTHVAHYPSIILAQHPHTHTHTPVSYTHL